MSSLPGKKRAYQDHLRYKNMVARLENLDVRKLETELLRELAKGRRWRIDAVLEAIAKSPFNGLPYNGSEIMATAGRFGRLTAISRLSQMEAITGKDGLLLDNLLIDAFQQAVIHDHYRVADFCARSRHGQPIGLFTSNKAYVDAMTCACEQGDVRKVDYLLSCGADMSQALNAAVHAQSVAVIDHLVKAGADVNRPFQRYTPLQIAVFTYKNEAMVEALLAHDADAISQGSELLYAIAFRDDFIGIFDKLVAAGARPTEESFREAMMQGAVDIVKRHTALGFVPTHMHLVNALAGHVVRPELVKLCLDAGVNPQASLQYLQGVNMRDDVHGYCRRAIAWLQDHIATGDGQATFAPKPPKPR